MNRVREALLNLWREVGRHAEAQAVVPRVAEILGRRLPVGGLAVWELDEEARAHRLAAYAFESPCEEPPEDDAASEALRMLVGSGRRLHEFSVSGERPAWAALGVGGDRPGVAVRLAPAEGPRGAAILTLEGACGEDGDAGALLAEPLEALLANDHRIRRLKTLTAAAEADRRALLVRLGRDQVDGDVVGAKGGLRSVMERVALVAASDAPVLILGETGSGKEVIAREIHRQSRRHEGPFVRVNCGAIPPELIDSQLFGHERGAFTGADAQRRGWFERADGGTLFLDEVGELPPAAQVRLLRVLQEGTFERVGGQREVHVDCRIVTATHRDLPRMVQEHRFREDLWYRIAVFPIVLPPLRERLEDIPELARHLCERSSNRFGLRVCYPDAQQIERLRAYSWPGNVRELASVIDRAALLGGGRTLEVDAALGGGASALGGASRAPSAAGPESLDDAVRRHIRLALDAAAGRIEGRGGAADLLRVNPHTLRGKMRRLGIRWQEHRPRGGRGAPGAAE